MRNQMHSQLMASQVMTVVDKYGQHTMELDTAQYTWKSLYRHDTKQDELIMLAITLSRIKPHYQMDMCHGVKTIKELTLICGMC